MAQQTMYAGVNNSPQTTLTQQITAQATEILVGNTIGFPQGPNLATIGEDDEAEVIKYEDISVDALTGCVRGFDGTTARVWAADTLVYRGYTKYDHDTFKANIEDLENRKLNKADAGRDVAVDFTQADTRANIVTGETLAALFGKVRKWFADLKGAAFAAIGTGDSDVAAGKHAAQHRAGGVDALTASDINALPDTFTETDPTVPAWAKQPTKPTYTPAETSSAPALHAPQHATDGTDPLTPADIGAASATKAVDATLPAPWSTTTQTLTIEGASPTSAMGLSDTATQAQREAARKAMLTAAYTGENTVTVTADGEVPTIDLPCQIIIWG